MSDELLKRAKAYGCDIRATHDSLMLVGDLAARIRELEADLATARAERDIAKYGVPGPIAQQGLRYLSMKARAEQAEADLDAARAERDALQLQLNMRPTMKMDQCETYCETAQRLVAEQDALRVALTATDHLYDGDGFVRTCYEYDDNQAAWNAMEFARKAALKEPRT